MLGMLFWCPFHCSRELLSPGPGRQPQGSEWRIHVWRRIRSEIADHDIRTIYLRGLNALALGDVGLLALAFRHAGTPVPRQFLDNDDLFKRLAAALAVITTLQRLDVVTGKLNAHFLPPSSVRDDHHHGRGT